MNRHIYNIIVGLGVVGGAIGATILLGVFTSPYLQHHLIHPPAKTLYEFLLVGIFALFIGSIYIFVIGIVICAFWIIGEKITTGDTDG